MGKIIVNREQDKRKIWVVNEAVKNDWSVSRANKGIDIKAGKIREKKQIWIK